MSELPLLLLPLSATSSLAAVPAERAVLLLLLLLLLSLVGKACIVPSSEVMVEAGAEAAAAAEAAAPIPPPGGGKRKSVHTSICYEGDREKQKREIVRERQSKHMYIMRGLAFGLRGLKKHRHTWTCVCFVDVV